MPEYLGEGAAIVYALAQRSMLEAIAERLLIPRRGGFPGVDAFLYVLWALTGPGRGLSWLYERSSSFFAHLGALAGRDTLCSASTLFRILPAVHDKTLDDFGPWLLREACGAATLLQQPATQLRDAKGQLRHLFAFDPVRFALRLRALPEDPALPPPKRHVEQLGAKGHAGRKRGELVTSLGLLEHLGSGLVLDVTVSPGNGCVRALFHRAVAQVCDTMAWLGQTLSHAVLLCDGEFGTVPYLCCAFEAGLALLTRCSRYDVLHTDAVVAHMACADWRAVEDSLSGPRREACELGLFHLPAGQGTLRDDGTPYPPVPVRLIVSRYRSTEDDNGHGQLIDGYRYELFAVVHIEAESLPAAEVVALFYSRCGQECRFSQRNTDLDFQYPYTHSLAGLRLVQLVLFFVWNSRIIAGTSLHPPLPTPPAPVEHAACSGSQAPAHGPPPPVAQPPPEVAQVSPAAEPGEPPSEEQQEQTIAAERAALLNALPWPQLLRRRAGWRWDGEQQLLLDAEGAGYPLVGVELRGRRADLRFQRQLAEGLKPKQLSLALSAEQAEPVRQRLTHRTQKRNSVVRPRIDPSQWLQQLALDPPPPRYALQWPMFIATAARDAFLAAVREMEIWIVPGKPEVRDSGHPLVAQSRAHRQHRRKTYAERVNAHRGPPPKEVRIIVQSKSMGRWLLGPSRKRRPQTPRN